MPDLVIFKDETGRLSGWGEKGRRAYDKFRKLVAELTPGEMLHFHYRLPRSPQHHRFFFARLAALFERQERFETVEHLLEWLKVGAGHVDLLPGKDGTPVAIPKSIAWHNLDEQGFIEFTRAMNDFLWTHYAQEALWPHLDERQRHAMVDQWFREVQ
jgi:hypothetical protein